MKTGWIREAISTAVIAGLVLTATPFSAVAASANDLEGSWAKPIIASWMEKGLVSGYADGTFRPDAPVTRAEFVTMANHSLGMKKEADISFTDVSASDWCYDALRIAIGNGYVSGYEDGSFGVNHNITREQAAVMLQRAKALATTDSSTTKFTDEASISKWAADAVYAAVSKGYFSGYPDGSFRARNYLTRAEAVAVLDKARNGSDTISKAVTVDKAGVVIQNQTIAGDLILSEKIGSGSVTIENTTVNGNVIVNGGGSNSIHLKDSTIQGKVQMNYSNVRVVVEGDTHINAVQLHTAGTLDANQFSGSIGSVEIDKSVMKNDIIHVNAPATLLEVNTNANVNISANVETVLVTEDAAGARLEIANTARVGTLQANASIDIAGKGKLALLEANASGIKTAIKADNVNTASNVSKPTETTTGGGSSGGGGGSSSGGSSSTQKELRVEDFVLLSNSTLKVKLNQTSANLKFALKDTQSNKDMYVFDGRLEEDGYYYVYTSTEVDQGIHLNGTYQLIVSGSGYTTLTYDFQGADMLDNFWTSGNEVYSVTTETGRNQLRITIHNPALEDVAFTVMEDGIDILKTAAYAADAENPDAATVYTLDLTKEITGGKTYRINMSKQGFHDSSVYYVPVASVTIENKEFNQSIACGEDVYDILYLSVTVSPSNATHKQYDCVIEDESIVHMDPNSSTSDYCVLTNGTAEGSTKVKMVSPDGGVFDEMTIEAKIQLAEDIQNISKNIALMKPNETDGLFVELRPHTAANKEIIWTSSDNSIATAEGLGTASDGSNSVKITGVSPGTAIITATAADGGGASTSFTAIVYESSLEFEDDTIINNTISKNAGELRILRKLNPEDSFVSVNPDYDTQIQLQTFEWSTTTPELITLRKSTSSCYITPTGTAGTAKLIYDSRTNLGGGRHIVIEMDIIITD